MKTIGLSNCPTHFSSAVPFLILPLLMLAMPAKANFITANPTNYTSYLSGLTAGDTLYLSAGNYTNQLNLNNRMGTAVAPIVVMGEGVNTVFLGNACCNTVNLTNCAYLVIRDFKLDGQNINYIDGVKAGGGGNNFAHHITLENLVIVNHGGNIAGDNQTVGISTKCAAWSWTIRRCVIIGAGTGIYLGNSDSTCPFVGGLIENNLVINTRGYNMQVKAQKDNVRQIFAATSNDSQTTIIRYNVWSKDSGSTMIGEGDGSRPCLLMDHFPSTGFGSHDRYEVYGNFFFNNPTEALMQVTANAAIYNNIFVNHVAPSGYRTIVINDHDGFPPRDINVFHNTVLSSSPSGGIGLFNPNSGYEQYCYANAVFSNGTPISGFQPLKLLDNIVDTYANANAYVLSPSATLSLLDVYPLAGQLEGALTDNTPFTDFTDFNVDFNGNPYIWTFRGAYSGSGINPGWALQLDTMPTPHGTITGLHDPEGENDFLGILYPNPASNEIVIALNAVQKTFAKIELSDLEGKIQRTLFEGELESGQQQIHGNVADLQPGFYFLLVQTEFGKASKKVLIQR